MQEKQSLNLSTAIIFAAIIVAGGLFFGLKSSDNGGSKITTTTGVGKIDIRLLDDSDYILGSPDADITLIEYSDLECPACKFFEGSLEQTLDKYGKDGTFAWVYRQFPLTSLHSQAIKESEAILCAGKLGGNNSYWDLVNKIFEVTPSNNGLDLAKLPDYAVSIGLDKAEFEECLNSGEMIERIQAEYNEAVMAEAGGTPFSILVLKKPLSKDEITSFESYAKLKGLAGAINGNLVEVKNGGKIITLGAALYPDDLVELVGKLINRNF